MFGIKKGLAFLSPAESGMSGAGAVEPAAKEHLTSEVGEGSDASPIVFSDAKSHSSVPTAKELREAGSNVISWPVKTDPHAAEKVEALRVLHHSNDLTTGLDPIPEEVAHAKEVLADMGEKHAESDIDVTVGDVWGSEEAAFRVEAIVDDGQSIEIVYIEGPDSGKHQTLTPDKLLDLIDTEELSVDSSVVAAEGEQSSERANPLVRPVVQLLGNVRSAAEGRKDEKMLVYVSENDELFASLATKKRLDNAELGLIKDVCAKLEAYLEAALQDAEKASEAVLVRAEMVAEQPEHAEESLEAFREGVSRYAEEVTRQIGTAADMSELESIGTAEERPVKDTRVSLRMFARVAGGQFDEAVKKTKGSSQKDLWKILNNADGELRKAWYAKKDALSLEAKTSQKDRGSAPKKVKNERKKKSVVVASQLDSIDKDDAAREATLEKPGADPDSVASEFGDHQRTSEARAKKASERHPDKAISKKKETEGGTYERLEKIAEDDGAYYTLLGAIATGVRMIRETVPGIEVQKKKYMSRIVDALTTTLGHSFSAVSERYGWSDEEGRIFMNNLIEKGIEKFLK